MGSETNEGWTKAERARIEPSIVTDDDRAMMDAWLEVGPLIRHVAKGYGETALFTSHDVAKRLHRMGYRKVAEPILSTCRCCGAQDIVTSQSVCINCVGQPARVSPSQTGR